MKVDRLVSIIMILLEKKRVSAKELADTFEVSKRTVYRDIDAIARAGIPVYATAGVGGGFEIMPGFKLDKQVFSADDLSSLLMGLTGLSQVVHGNEIIHTLAKVKSFIPAEQAEDIALKVSKFRIDMDPWITNPVIKETLELVEMALNSNRLLSFSYISQHGNIRSRKIEPYQLISKNSNWYIYGFCLTQMDYRLFKLSRMIKPEVCEDTFLPRAFPEHELTADRIADSLRITIKLRVHYTLLERLLDYCDYSKMVPEDEEYYIVDFPFIDRDYYYDMLLGFGEKCECLEPAEVRQKMIEKIKKVKDVYPD